MIQKKPGKINEVVYQNTVYHDGQYHYYLTLEYLFYLIDKIIETHATTEFVRFIPFYLNLKKNGQIELDEHMFFLMCKDKFSEEDRQEHQAENMDRNYDTGIKPKTYNELSEEEKRIAGIRYPLCHTDDTESYKGYLLAYKTYLYELIPIMFERVKKSMKLTEEDIPFGHFCFEVNSN